MAQTVKTAFGYIRESTDDQLEYSPEAQRKKLHEYAQKNGYILEDRHIFSDAGVSGKRASKRPAFQEMIALAKSKEHPCDVILVWKFSRFARNQEESIVYKSMLRRDGVDVISVTEPLADGPFGALIERIIEWMDEYYSIRLAEEVKKGMSEKARRGELQASPPFGYRVENNRLIPIEEEAALVRELFERYAAGAGMFPLAKEFNARGIRTHRGNRFENRTVDYILQNPVYIGKLRWNPAGRTSRNFQNENIILSESVHEPLVSQSLFDEVQQKIAASKALYPAHSRPATELKDWPSGLVRCSACGRTLIWSAPHYYKCSGYTHGRCTVTQHIHAETLKASIIAQLEADLHRTSEISPHLVFRSDLEAPAQSTTVRLQLLEHKLQRLRDAYLSGADTLEEYKAAKAMIEGEIDSLKRSADARAKAVSLKAARAALRTNLAKALKTLTSPTASVEDKNTAARSVLETCILDKASNTLSITYRVFF